MGVRATNPLTRQAIDIRSLHTLGSIAAQIPISEIIGQNENHIWHFGLMAGASGKQCRERQEQMLMFHC